MRLLSLFHGTGSIAQFFENAGWDVVSIDIDPKSPASFCQDIRTWDWTTQENFDVIWAGPPCENYSVANTRGKRNYLLADSLVRVAWAIISHFLEKNPDLIYFVENPAGSHLWRREVGKPLTPQIQLDMCAYGRLWRKRTRLATNSNYVPRALCDPSTCPSCHNGKHIQTAQRGPQKNETHDTVKLSELHAYPPELCKEIYEFCARHITSHIWHMV